MHYEAIIYYTCAEDAIGSKFELTFGDSNVTGEIKKFYDPEEYGEHRDRSPRIESYVKDFYPLSIGKIKLNQVGQIQ